MDHKQIFTLIFEVDAPPGDIIYFKAEKHINFPFISLFQLLDGLDIDGHLIGIHALAIGEGQWGMT